MKNLLEGFDTSAKIRAMLAARGEDSATLAGILGVIPKTIDNRVAINKWDIRDLAKIAKHFGCEVADLI